MTKKSDSKTEKCFQKSRKYCGKRRKCWLGLVIFIYLSLLPVAHLRNAPRRQLVVKGDSARIQDETTESLAWFFNVLLRIASPHGFSV